MSYRTNLREGPIFLLLLGAVLLLPGHDASAQEPGIVIAKVEQPEEPTSTGPTRPWASTSELDDRMFYGN